MPVTNSESKNTCKASRKSAKTQKTALSALLSEGWARDMTTFLVLSQEVLLSLLSFCTACSIHGVQTRECGHTSRSPLDTLESAIGFPGGSRQKQTSSDT